MSEQRIIRFMRIRTPMAIFSLLVVLAGIVSMATKGLNLGLDFTGGTTAELNYAQPVDQEAVRAALIELGFNAGTLHTTGYGSDITALQPGDVVRVYEARQQPPAADPAPPADASPPAA